jgi:glyceraldehyde 3-phosphate dehydrogenase
MALTVPVSSGSITDMVFTLKKEVSKEEVNEALKEAAEDKLKGVLEYTEEPIVSADIVGNPHSSIVDGLSTMVLGNKNNVVKILSWYDNEWGFASRLVSLIKFVVNQEKNNSLNQSNIE